MVLDWDVQVISLQVFLLIKMQAHRIREAALGSVDSPLLLTIPLPREETPNLVMVAELVRTAPENASLQLAIGLLQKSFA